MTHFTRTLALMPLIVLVSIFACDIVRCDDEDDRPKKAPSEIELKTDRVVVFKDGYCLVVKSATAKTDQHGQAFTEDVPDAAVLGSFWAIAEGSEIRSMVAGWQDSTSETDRESICREMIEFMQANEGKDCSFLIGEQRLSGVIGKTLNEPDEATAHENTNEQLTRHLHATHGSHLISLAHTASPGNPSTASHHFVLQTRQGDVLIDARQVRQLQVNELETRFTRHTKTHQRRKRLTLQFDQKNADVKFKIIYFRPGVRWIPTYRIDLNSQLVEADAKRSPKKSKGKKGAENQPAEDQPAENGDDKLAHVSLQCELINKAEDLIDMPIDVVVGVPNFRFRNVPSPLVLERVMINTLNRAVARTGNDNFNLNSFSNAVYLQVASDFRSERAGHQGSQAEMQLQKDLTGSAGNDLFVYHLPNMTLKRGERATVPIMNAKVRYRDLYTWDVHVKHNDIYVGSGTSAGSPLILTKNKVWRQIELVNDTKIPWTTGPAMFMDGFQPIAQELLTYTSPGGICRVPVTVSVDLRGRAEDAETQRDPEHLKWNGHHYARVHGRTRLELANNKTESVPVEVRLTFGGIADKISDRGEKTVRSFRQQDWQNYRGETAVNNSSTVLWNTTVEPGECFKPTVDYHFFIRH